MQTAITVSALNEQIKNLLEATFMQVAVEGELSRITYHNSGHIYFTLKDNASALSGVMFRGNASRLKFRLEEGLKVTVHGGITLYKPRGSYQINAVSIEPAGHGALALAYEQLKKKLSEEGLFSAELKKSLPRFPKRIALITSATGAALQDMKRVAMQRWPLAELYVYDSIVQGEQAPFSLVQALRAADAGSYDVIVLSRGGGSIEDLWGFNDETLARTVAAAKTPVVSAVGHEIDWVITDFAADLRAPTPSAAMQMILPDQNEVLMSLDTLVSQYDRILDERMNGAHREIVHLQERYRQHSVDRKLAEQFERIHDLAKQLDQKVAFRLEQSETALDPIYSGLDHTQKLVLQQKTSRLEQLKNALAAQNPGQKDKRGFAQIVRDHHPVALSQLHPGDTFKAMDSRYSVLAEVKEITKIDIEE